MTIDESWLIRMMESPAETEHVEFKEAKNKYSEDKVREYCVALANEGGG